MEITKIVTGKRPWQALDSSELIVFVIWEYFWVGGWGVSQPGNLNGSCVHDPVAGVLELQLSSGRARSPVPLGFVHLNVDQMV